MLLLVPNPGAGVWATTYSVPAFFTSARVPAAASTPGEIVLPEPVGSGRPGDAVAGGLGVPLPDGGRPAPDLAAERRSMHPPGIAQIAVGYPPVREPGAAAPAATSQAKDVTLVIVDKR